MRIAWMVGALLIGIAAAARAEAPSQRWALLIGVDDYNELEEDLQCAGNDQRALARQLIASGFPEDQAFLLEDKAKEKKYLPFRQNIERQLKLVLAMPRPNDLLIVGFSGHGVTLENKRYLCPTEARLDDVTTLLAVDDLYQQLTASRATLKLVFLDACRAGDPRPPEAARAAATLPGLATFSTTAVRPPAGLMILSSCGENQIAMEDQQQLGQGVFMHFVIEGLRGKAANGAGLVTLASLYDYTSLETQKYVARRWNDFQTPALDGKIDGPFELARLDRRPSGLGPPQPAELPPTPAQQSTNSIGMNLVLIPSGEFMMGSPADEKDRQDDEGPRHRVRITRPFYLGQYEVTKRQFARFVEATDYRTDAEKDGKGGFGYIAGKAGGIPFGQKPEFTWRSWGVEQSDDSPVVNVSWNDAVAFCAWLSRKEGKPYRLPSEAEWEYACRAGTTSRYSTGADDASLRSVANVADASLKRLASGFSWATDWDDGHPLTSPVGRFQPNPFGLYDMHGNVWEWCSDWYATDYYAGSPSDDPQGPSTGSGRVFRGGGWYSAPRVCRSAVRLRFTPVNRDFFLGFRVAWCPR